MNRKITLITGGSRGLGRSMAIHLADHGSDVILTYRSNRAEADNVVRLLEQKGRKSHALALDLGQSSSFTAFSEELLLILSKKWDRRNIDHLVNNGGMGLYGTLAETTEAQFDDLMRVHFKGTYFLTQKLLPLICDGGRIINISSGLTRFSYPGYSAYAAMKGAVETLTRYMAAELGPRRITVNVVAPGAIETDFGGARVRNDRQLNQIIASQTAMGRVGQPDDIGGAVALLLSPEAQWINGQRIEVSGGIHL